MSLLYPYIKVGSKTLIIRNLPEGVGPLLKHAKKKVIQAFKPEVKNNGTVIGVLTRPIEITHTKKKSMNYSCGTLYTIEKITYRVVPNMGALTSRWVHREYRVDYSCLEVERKSLNKLRAELMMYKGPNGWRLVRILKGYDPAIFKLPVRVKPSAKAVEEAKRLGAKIRVPRLAVDQFHKWATIYQLASPDIKEVMRSLWIAHPPVIVKKSCLPLEALYYDITPVKGMGNAYNINLHVEDRNIWFSIVPPYPILVDFIADDKTTETLLRCPSCAGDLANSIFRNCPRAP